MFKILLAVIVLECSCFAADQEWIGVARDKFIDISNKNSRVEVPSLQVAKQVYLLTGKGLVTIEDLKKHRNYKVVGILKEDGKTIQVSKMGLRDSFQGKVYVGRSTNKDLKKHLTLQIESRVWRLQGALPDFSEIHNGDTWDIVGTEDENPEWITVTKMNKIVK